MKKKCIYCGKKVKSGKLNVEGILNKKELLNYKKSQKPKIVCEECNSTLFILQLT